MQINNVALGTQSCFCFTSSTITPAATGAATAAEQAFTITGQPSPLLSTDVVCISPNTAPSAAVSIGTVRVNSTGQLCITFVNPSAGSLTHTASAYTVFVARA